MQFLLAEATGIRTFCVSEGTCRYQSFVSQKSN
uniref:Uncharacterized protein n=1 Tax=Rhizophora mucronata TaxID=61149 RepID=A0A2P2N599_RHIMU